MNDEHERIETCNISTSQVRQIAEIATAAAVETLKTEFFKSIGENIISRILWIVCGAILALGAWLTTHDTI